MMQYPQSAKHGLAAGGSGRPQNAGWTIDQGWAHDTSEEHAVWQALCDRQTKLLPKRACEAFVAGMRALAIAADRIPDLRRLSDELMKATGWQVVAVPGLVPDDVVFDHLAHRRFPAGQFIRRLDQLDYLEEPDLFHDVFGHVPMLMNPVIADYILAYGVGGLRAGALGVLANLARVHWYTVESGLVMQADGLRIYGAGIVSSHAESLFALDDASPNRIRFELARVLRTRYRIDDFQETYCVLGDFDELLEWARIDFAPYYAQVKGPVQFEPGEVLATDRVVTRGTGRYHAGRRRPNQEGTG